MAETLMPDDETWERDVSGPRPGWPQSAPEQAPNSGQPWTDADYEEILAAARDGVTDIEELARRLGRSPHPTLQKAKRLLPVAERAAPLDRVMRLLRAHLEEPDYDWQRTTLEEPPPRPVISPPVYTGLRGLERDDLVRVTYALALAGGAGGEDLLPRASQELQRRGLVAELIDLRADRVVRQTEATWDQVVVEAVRWVDRVVPGAVSHAWPYPEYQDPTPQDYW